MYRIQVKQMPAKAISQIQERFKAINIHTWVDYV